MYANHLMNDQWRLDLSQSGGETGHKPTKHSQPWRFYWPPISQETVKIWVSSEFPEVLSWRFDRTRPFDRPWRTWTKSARAMREHDPNLTDQHLVGRLGTRTSKS
jgi:hypothetical protein